eukprot:gene10946-22858_t
MLVTTFRYVALISILQKTLFQSDGFWSTSYFSKVPPDMSLKGRITLEFYLENELLPSEALVSKIISSMAICASRISSIIATAPINKVIGKSNSKNSFDEDQKKLDVICNEIILNELNASNCVKIIASEEESNPIVNPTCTNGLIVTFDPLDGSSNIDCAIPTGTIFAILKPLSCTNDPLQNLLQPGSAIQAAGYCMYSSSTELVISVGKGTHGFTLDPSTNTFILTREDMKCPPRGPYYSLNEGRSPDWPVGLQTYISDIKNGRSKWGKKYSSRYVCSLVADVHRSLLYGGWAGNPRYHLRYLYEAAPLSFIAEQCGGAGSDGIQNILNIIPKSLHERLPVFIGSREDIEEIESYGDVQQKEIKKYDA